MAPSLWLLLLCPVTLYTSTVTSKTVCGRPRTTYGIDDSRLKSRYEIGDEVTLTCEIGYTPSTATPRRLACTASGEWTTSDGDLTCAPKMCPVPRDLQSKFGGPEVPFKTPITYTCSDGYVIKGSNISFCLPDGTWSHPPPLCEAVYCPVPKRPQGGEIIFDRINTGNTIMYGQGWTYRCYRPKTPSFKRGECGEDGNPTEPPSCGAPCTVDIERGRILYRGRRLWIGDLEPNRVLHAESVTVYCHNKAQSCGFPVTSTCNNGILRIPRCYEEPSWRTYNMNSGSLPSEIQQC